MELCCPEIPLYIPVFPMRVNNVSAFIGARLWRVACFLLAVMFVIYNDVPFFKYWEVLCVIVECRSATASLYFIGRVNDAR